MDSSIENPNEPKTPKSNGRGSDENLKSLMKIMRVLECFSVNDRALSLAEICDKTGFPRSTTHRLMASLREVGFLDQDRERDKYRLGLKLFELGNIVLMNLDLHREARPIVESLKRMSGQMVHLAIFDGLSAVVIHRADPSPDHAPTSTSIENAPVHCTSVGKAILAWQSDAVVQKVIDAGLRYYTEATITTGPALLEEMEQIRKRGYAIDDGEHQPGLRCVGAPIRNQSGEVIAGISVSGPSWQINMTDVEELSKVVMHHANLIGQRIGHHP
nr:IclR family transcriptional regulator [Brucella anthropi]